MSGLPCSGTDRSRSRRADRRRYAAAGSGDGGADQSGQRAQDRRSWRTMSGCSDHHVEGGADVNVELLFNSPDLLRYIGSPRPHVGADINTSGNTDRRLFRLLGDHADPEPVRQRRRASSPMAASGARSMTGTWTPPRRTAKSWVRASCSARAWNSAIRSIRWSASRRFSTISQCQSRIAQCRDNQCRRPHRVPVLESVVK